MTAKKTITSTIVTMIGSRENPEDFEVEVSALRMRRISCNLGRAWQVKLIFPTCDYREGLEELCRKCACRSLDKPASRLGKFPHLSTSCVAQDGPIRSIGRESHLCTSPHMARHPAIPMPRQRKGPRRSALIQLNSTAEARLDRADLKDNPCL
ncbi:hypothetical protein ACVJGD_007976 [Bradyrhizobium sp. USDA 10063]